MEVYLTEHAKLRLKERNIKLDEVVDITKNPKMKFYDIRNRHLIAIGERKEKKGHYLIIAYDRVRGGIEVVTVIDTSKSLEKIVSNRINNGRWIEL